MDDLYYDADIFFLHLPSTETETIKINIVYTAILKNEKKKLKVCTKGQLISE